MSVRMGVPGRVAVGAVALGAVVVGLSLRGPVGALLAPTPRAPAAAERAGAGGDDLEARVAMIDGRSLFFVPAAPPAPEPAPRTAEADEELDAPAQSPSRYEGPSLVAMVNGVAWFGDGRRLAPSGEADGDLRVVELVPPWEAVVEWKGVEFSVSLFERDEVVFPDGRERAASRQGRSDQDASLAMSGAERDDSEAEDKR